MKTKNLIFSLLAILGLLTSISSCVKQNYDMPPSNCDSLNNLKPSYSIKQLKALYDNDTVLLKKSVSIEGYVISTDQFGNFYKKIIIEDTSGGIELEINDTYMFTKYPIGQKIFVNCNGLVLGEYNGIKEIGMGYDLTNGIIRIAADSEKVYLTKICQISKQKPQDMDLSKISDDMLNKLVKINNVQFIASDTAKTWADVGSSANRTLIDASNDTLIVRTSNYASFAKSPVPNGSGYIIGILGKYGHEYQLYIRNTDDVKMDKARF